ncbi:hypothetical protein [Bradyrhizobium sp. 141]|uniref:hypothetical protein n=1 Tax=Bradyrhizobium sp. 141 TaxID=2782617 RepID=UPI001FFC169D|nr:hypothetical protein [Bradyrhizobium sp. 141]MCK1717393.1 hypothetical protein [Bradyrhizobium sp. 141]
MKNNPMHSSGGIEPLAILVGVITGACRTEVSLPASLFSFDTSGTTLAEWQHRKIRNTRAEQSVAGFFMSDTDCHDRRIAIVPPASEAPIQQRPALELVGGQLDARCVCSDNPSAASTAA